MGKQHIASIRHGKQLFLEGIVSNISFRWQNIFTKYIRAEVTHCMDLGQQVEIRYRIGVIGMVCASNVVVTKDVINE